MKIQLLSMLFDYESGILTMRGSVRQPGTRTIASSETSRRKSGSWDGTVSLTTRGQRAIFRQLNILTLLIFALFLNALPADAQVSPPSMPILFVHGWCGSPYDWAPFFTPFSTALPSSMYSNQTVYLVQYDSVTNAISFWSESDPSAGSNTTLTAIAENEIPSDARFFVIQLIDPTPTSTDPTDPTNVAKISVLNKAYEISQIAANIKTITKAPQVNILSHSMGGLDARAYVENMASAGVCYDYATDTPNYSAATCTPGAGSAAWTGNVANIITLDTPNTGSPLADSSLRKLIGLEGYTCEAATTTNSVEITPSNALLESLNYGGTELGNALPIALGTPVQALEDYASDVTKSWTGLSGYSDDIVLVPSQSITENIPPADTTAKLVDLPFPYLSSTVLADSGCTVSVLGKLEPIMHFLSCLGTLDPTLDAVETQLVDDSVPWISSWSVTPSTQPLGSNFAIGYSALDLSTYSLSSAELWRAPDNHGAPGTWSKVGTSQTLSGNGPTPVSFADAPATAGTFWYGSHLYDSGGNVAIQFPPAQVTVTPTVASIPGFAPAAGTYTSAQSVTISDSTVNVTIYYTTNGTMPSTGSTTYASPIAVSSTETIEAIAAGASNTPSAIATATYTITPPAAPPAFSPVAGTYASSQSVSISDATPGAAVYYTTNGVAPTTSSTRYTVALTVSATETIEAIALATGYSASSVSTATYTIMPLAATPVFSPAAGTYTSTQSVSISDTTPGSTIYYTTSGVTPTTASTRYIGAITVGTTVTIEAIAIASGYAASAIATAIYTITPVAATPGFSPSAGTYTSSQSVSISDTTPGSTIYYTSSGVTPTTASTRYTGAITISATETIEAIAVASGYTLSTVATAIYTIHPATATPGFTPVAGTYAIAQTVTISDATAGAAIYYTTNGNAPATSSNLYAAPLVIGVSSTPTIIKAIAISNGYGTSATASATYDIPAVPGALTVPTPDTQTPLTGTRVTFSWTPGNIATRFEFYVGTMGPGSSNLYNSGNVTATTAAVSGLPDNDTTVYARLYSLVDGVWQYYDYTYVSAGIATKAVLTAPTPNVPTPLSGASVTFSWTPSNITTRYDFYVGSTGAGSSNLYNSGNISVTSATVNGLPNNGQPVYARLYTLINGAWVYNDYTYVAHGSPVEAALTTPAPDTSTPLTGTRVTFAWTPGNLATQFQFTIGNAGVGSNNLYNSGSVTSTTETVSGLTANGQTLYVRLSSLLVNGTWQSTDYTYKASGSPIAATLTTPAPDTSTPLSGAIVTFSWAPGNIATHFEFWVGTSVGSSNLYDSGNISTTSVTVSGLASNGEKLYARLYSLFNGAWQYTDYTYYAYGSPTPAALTTPKPGGTLAGPSATFSWNPGNTATNFELYLGSTGAGSSNLYSSGNVTATSETVNVLPVNSEKIYARLYWLIDGVWNYADYTYTAF